MFDEPVETTIFTWDGPKDTVLTPNDSLKHHLRFMHTGFFAMEPKTGYVLAWVGGIDHRFFKYDHVKSKRQVGSTFKPIVYATAIEQGISPCEYFPNQKITYDKYGWTPGNSSGEYGGYYSMMGGLTHSVNTVAAAIIMKTGVQPVIAEARKMGIKGDLPQVPSIALGTASLSLQEMVTAYGCFANRGLKAEPQYLVRIETAEGEILYEHEAIKKTRALSQETADIMIQIMKSVVNNGTATRLRGTYGLGMDLAGKTGTTQNNTDGWFIGYNSRIVAGAWVGAEDPAIRWKTTGLGQGAATALPIFGKFMNKSSRDSETRRYVTGGFTAPPDSVMANLSCNMWIPDSISADSIGFIPSLISNIKEFLNKTGQDSLLPKYPGAEGK
jgi:penicillin-binding protein 1A